MLFSKCQIRVDAYRAEDSTVKATTLVRLSVTRNANRPIFRNGISQLPLSEDQILGTVITQVSASDADDVSCAGKNK